MATNTAPAAWRDESDEMLATVIDIFTERAAAIDKARRKRK